MAVRVNIYDFVRIVTFRKTIFYSHTVCQLSETFSKYSAYRFKKIASDNSLDGIYFYANDILISCCLDVSSKYNFLTPSNGDR